MQWDIARALYFHRQQREKDTEENDGHIGALPSDVADVTIERIMPLAHFLGSHETAYLRPLIRCSAHEAPLRHADKPA
jgi:hypothetical protein